MSTDAYRRVLDMQQQDTLRRQAGYPIPPHITQMMVRRRAVAPRRRTDAYYAKIGLATQRRLVLALTRAERRLTTEFTAVLMRLFNALGADAAAAYTAAANRMVVKADPPLLPEDASIADDAISRLRVQQWQARTFIPVYEQMVASIALATIDEINIQTLLAVNIPDMTMRRLVAEGGTRAGLIDIPGETRDALFKAMFDGRSRGEGVDAITARIKQYVPAGRFRHAGVEYRAKMIARTEIKYTQNSSSIAAYRGNPRIIGLRAFDAQLGETDEDCMLRNGRTYSLDEAEQIRDHPNGTLSWAPVRAPITQR